MVIYNYLHKALYFKVRYIQLFQFRTCASCQSFVFSPPHLSFHSLPHCTTYPFCTEFPKPKKPSNLSTQPKSNWGITTLAAALSALTWVCTNLQGPGSAPCSRLRHEWLTWHTRAALSSASSRTGAAFFRRGFVPRERFCVLLCSICIGGSSPRCFQAALWHPDGDTP